MQNQDFPLHMAVRRNDYAHALAILKSDPSRVNVWDPTFETALSLVYDRIYFQADSRLPIIQLLLDHGADVNARSRRGVTPLIRAVCNGQINGVKLLLENGTDPNSSSSYNDYPHYSLLTAVREGEEEIAELLLQYGANIETVNPVDFGGTFDGKTPLDAAISNENINIMKILVKAGAKANDVYYSLVRACIMLAYSVIEYAFDHKDSIYSFGSVSAECLLYYVHFVYKWYHPDYEPRSVTKLVELMLLKLYGITSFETSITALHGTVCNEDEEHVQDLLRAGMDVNARTPYGDTPLHLLLRSKKVVRKRGLNKSIKILQLLLDHGADIWALNHFGHTPFTIAVRLKNVGIINVMLSHSTGVKINDQTAEHDEWKISYYSLCELRAAASLGYEKVVDRLIDMEFNHPSGPDLFKNVPSPLYFAVQGHHANIVKMLLEAGFQVDARLFTCAYYLLRLDYADQRILCLLSEYKIVPLLADMVIETLCTFISADLIPNRAVNLLVFWYAMVSSSPLQKLNKEFIRMSSVLESNVKLSSILAFCNDKIGRLKEEKVCHWLSKYNLLAITLDSLVNALNDTGNLRACQNLYDSINKKPDEERDFDECMMMTRIELAIEKRKLWDAAKDRLLEYLGDCLSALNLESLPDEIVFNILANFNVRELKKFVLQTNA